MNSNRPPRPYWTGFLKLSLVTCGVRLYNATTETERVKLNEIHATHHRPVGRQNIVKDMPELGVIPSTDIIKGYQYEKDSYLPIDPEELRSLKLNSTDVIDVQECVDFVDPCFFEKPFYLLPEGGASEQAYQVIYEALRASGSFAIGQVVVSKNERVLAIRAGAHGLIAYLLRYWDELRPAADYYGTVHAPAADPAEVEMMRTIIARRTSEFVPERYTDHYAEAVRELIAQKLAGEVPVSRTLAPRPQAGNLMDRLKASLAAETAVEPEPEAPKPTKKGKGKKAR